jgi:biotin carboxyl carrier protein
MSRVEVRSEVAGSVWQAPVAVGDTVAEGDPVLVLESMKMEVPVDAPVAGRIAELHVGEGDPVAEEQVVAVLETD